jgi:mxaJ protein
MCLRFLSVAFFLATLFFAPPSVAARSTAVLRVCADPDNLPFSNSREQGFENRLARMAGNYLHEEVQFVWQRQGRGFIREFMNSGKCDLVVGIPAAFRGLLITKSYYRSSYVFLTRSSAQFQPVSLDDPELKNRRIAVEALEEEYTPPAEALAHRGLQNQLVGIYSVGAHSRDIAEAVKRGKVDLGIMWGPTAGYIARRSSKVLSITPVRPSSDGPLPFTFAISMGVRNGDVSLQRKLDAFLSANAALIHRLLDLYGVPQLPLQQTTARVSP